MLLRYKLDDLGWFQFEHIVQSMLKAQIGIGVESWGGHGDRGRDAFYRGSLRLPTTQQSHPGPFVFQVKFVEEANAAGAKPDKALLQAVRREISRITTRKNIENCVYVLITNVAFSADLRTKVTEILSSKLRTVEVITLGGQDVCDILDNHPNIRQSFPQILGLADLETFLSSIVAKPVLERSRGMIEEAKDLAAVFYPTKSYSEAWAVLSKHGFVVLEGPPEVGKTAIARMVALARLSGGWETFECLGPDDFFQLYSSEKQQIFIADDAFGSTEYDPARTREWERSLDKILRFTDKGHWVIWTARKHILEMALERMRFAGTEQTFPAPGALLVVLETLRLLKRP